MENTLTDLIKTAIADVFGESNYEWASEKLTIKIPNAVVRNEKGASHPITNLFVRIGLRLTGSTCYLVGSLLGTRSTVTADEYLAGYCHSHLNSMEGFSTFCLGSSPLSTTIANLQYTGITRMDIDEFYAFLFMVEQLANSESIAGVPYRKIKDIGKKGRSGSVLRIQSSELRESYDIFMRLLTESANDELKQIKLSINLHDNRVTIANPHCKLIEDCLKIATPHRQLRTSTGMYTDTNATSLSASYRKLKRHPSFCSFTFKGETIRMTVDIPEIDPSEMHKEEDLFAHSSVRNYVITALENILTSTLLNFLYNYERQRIERGNAQENSQKRSADNRATSIFKNLVPVSPD